MCGSCRLHWAGCLVMCKQLVQILFPAVCLLQNTWLWVPGAAWV